MIDENIAAKGTLFQNGVGAAVAILVSAGLGLWYTPFLIGMLGIAAFSIVPLIAQLVSYMSLLTNAINLAVGRHLTVNMEQNDITRAHITFNSSLTGMVCVCLFLLIPIWVFAGGISHVINVPTGLDHEVRFLFLSAAAAFILTALASPFAAAAFARNRLYLNSAVLTGGNLIRVGTVALLFMLTAPALKLVGFGLLFSGFFTLAASIVIWRTLIPELRFTLGGFDYSFLRVLGRTGGWVMVNQLGAIFLLGINLFIVNRMLGPESGGYYATMVQWSAVLQNITGHVGSLFAPTLIAAYARQDVLILIVKARQAIKFVGLLLALPVGVIVSMSRPLLEIWLGPDYSAHSSLLQLIIAPASILLCIWPLFSVLLGADEVKIPGIVMVIAGLFNIAMAVALVRFTDMGMYGVAIAGIVANTLVNIVFYPMYVAALFNQAKTCFYRELLLVAVATGMVAALGYISSLLYVPGSWLGLVICGSCIAIVYGALAYSTLLGDGDKKAVGTLAVEFAHYYRKIF